MSSVNPAPGPLRGSRRWIESAKHVPGVDDQGRKLQDQRPVNRVVIGDNDGAILDSEVISKYWRRTELAPVHRQRADVRIVVADDRALLQQQFDDLDRRRLSHI